MQKQPKRPDTMRRLSPLARSETKIPLDEEIAHLRGLDLKGLRARWQSMFEQSRPYLYPGICCLRWWPTVSRRMSWVTSTLRPCGSETDAGIRTRWRSLQSDRGFDRRQSESSLARS